MKKRKMSVDVRHELTNALYVEVINSPPQHTKLGYIYEVAVTSEFTELKNSKAKPIAI